MHSSPFTMRQYNLSMMKPPVATSNNIIAPSPPTSTPTSTPTTLMSASTSLDLLRQNIQRKINEEIQKVISKYIVEYVKPAIANMRANLGQDAVTEDHIVNLCRQILEEAKQMYPVSAHTNMTTTTIIKLEPQHLSSHPQNSQGGMIIRTADGEQKFTVPLVLQQQSQQQQQVLIHQPVDNTKLPLTSPSSFHGIKRESDTDSEASCMSNASKKPKKSKANNNNNNNTNSAGRGGGSKNSNSNNSQCSSNDNSNSNDNSSSPPKTKKPSGPFRKHVALWDPNKLTQDTLFIMGAKANKALGFAQTRGRLYVKHPGLFKYASDADDKEWLSKNKLMPATGGRAYIMLLEDIEKLAKDNALNAQINYEDIKGFKVPEFILDKMRNYINTWKKNYAEEDEKTGALHNRQKNNNKQSSSSSATTPANKSSNTNSNAPLPAPPTPNSNSNSNSNTNVMIVTTMGGPQTPQLQPQPQYHQQDLNHHPHHVHLVQQQPGGSLNSTSNAFTTTAVLYDPSNAFSTTSQPQDQQLVGAYLIDKPPPVYPGGSSGQVSQQAQGNHFNLHVGGGGGGAGGVDPIEQAITKGDWSQVSDRSLLQYALQSTRNIGSWDPQDSFDLIESVTNGGGGGGNVSVPGGPGSGSGGMGETSPLMQISPNPGAHLTAPPLGPVSPNCELSAVLDQVSAYQYTET